MVTAERFHAHRLHNILQSALLVAAMLGLLPARRTRPPRWHISGLWY